MEYTTAHFGVEGPHMLQYWRERDGLWVAVCPRYSHLRAWSTSRREAIDRVVEIVTKKFHERDRDRADLEG